ncbi:MAG: alpha/beta hydrolase [Gemmatimonadaceae bacterium]
MHLGLGALALAACRTAAPGNTPPIAAVADSASPPPPAIALWSGRAPGAVGDSADDRPTLTPFVPTPATGSRAAIVIFPGGGYQHLAFDKEGVAVARRFNTADLVAFVVKYRLGPRYHHPTMLRDAQRAIRLVRSRAAEWGVDPGRIGVLGFSAGGHLASTAGTHFDAGDAAAPDVVERVSSRPDFMILVYPVITMAEPFAHRGSRTNLLGTDPTPALVQLLSNETQVTRATPPTFLVTSTDDRTVPMENSLRFYEALKRDSVPVELHVFETGRHGFALAPTDPVLSVWPSLAESWMRRRGLLAAAAH